MSEMDVDFLQRLNFGDKNSFEPLKLENEKSLNEILNDLEKSIECAIHDTGEEVLGLNSKNRKISSATSFGHLINVVSSTLEDLNDVSEKNSCDFHQNESEELIVLADKDCNILENHVENPNTLQQENTISSRYPELFEIFSENSSFSNFSLSSESEIWSRRNIRQHFTDKNPEKFVTDSPWKFQPEESLFGSDNKSSLFNSTMEKVYHQDRFSEIPKKNIPEKLSSTLNIKFEKLGDCSEKFKKLQKGPIFQTKTNPIQIKVNLTNSKNCKEMKAPKRKKCNDSWNIWDSHSSSKIKKISSSLENIPPLSFTSVFSGRTDVSNSSSNSWRIGRDASIKNNENNFFTSRSILEVETDSCFTKSKVQRGRFKLKSGDSTKVKKKEEVTSSLETVQGDNKVKLKSLILAEKSDTKINTELNIEIKSGKKQADIENQIFMIVIDVLVNVKSTLFENRKLVRSIQKHFQDYSVLHTIISDSTISLLNEGISRCVMKVQNKEKSRNVIVGANQLLKLKSSVLILMQVVEEEQDYLKQQEYYYCKRFLGLTEECESYFGDFKKNTKHTVIGNNTLLSSSQKDKIEQLITSCISFIKNILPENLTKKKETSNIPLERSLKSRNPSIDLELEKGPETQIEMSSELKNHSLNFESKNEFLTNSKKQITQLESEPKLDLYFLAKPVTLEHSKIKNKNSNDEKLIKSSNITLNGSCNNSRTSSSKIIKPTNKARSCNNVQPIWKPGGSVKISTPTLSTSKKNTRKILSSLDKKKEKQCNELTRNLPSSRSIVVKQSSFQNSNSQIQRSIRENKGRESEKVEISKSNLIPKHRDSREENLSVSQNIEKSKRRPKRPEAIKMLKELIKSTLEDEEEKTVKTVDAPECIAEISVDPLKTRSKSDSSRSNLISTVVAKQENVDNSSIPEIDLRILKKSENTLTVNSQESRRESIPTLAKSEKTLNSDILIPKTARVQKSESENSIPMLSIKNKILSSHIKNSISKVSVSQNKIKEKPSRNENLNSSKSLDLKRKSEHKEVRKPYLRKNANDFSYLESYMRLNSCQSLTSNNSCKSLRGNLEVKKEGSKIFDSCSRSEITSKNKESVQEDTPNIQENEISRISESKNSLNFNSKQNFSLSSCELSNKVSSSKYCQVSLEPSSCSRTSDTEEVLKIEVNSSCSDMFFEKKKQILNKSEKSFLVLEEILQQRGLNVDPVDEAESRKLSLKEKGSLKSILLDKGKGSIVAICSSQTLYDKLTSLSNSSIEEFEMKDASNQCSLDSFNHEIKLLVSQEFFQNSGTSLSSESVRKSENPIPICVTSRREDASSEEKVDANIQTDFRPNSKSEECQTVFIKRTDTATEKVSFEKLTSTDAEVSCSLKDFYVPKEEESAEVSIEPCEEKTQTEVNPENCAKKDFHDQSFKTETNEVKKTVTNYRDNSETLEIYNNSEDAVSKNSFCEAKQEFSVISTTLEEKINNQDFKLPKFEENFSKEDKRFCEVEENLPLNSMSKEKVSQEDLLNIERNTNFCKDQDNVSSNKVDNEKDIKISECERNSKSVSEDLNEVLLINSSVNHSSINSSPIKNSSSLNSSVNLFLTDDKIDQENSLSSFEKSSIKESKELCKLKTESFSVNDLGKQSDEKNIEIDEIKNVCSSVNDEFSQLKNSENLIKQIEMDSESKLEKKDFPIEAKKSEFKNTLNSVLKKIANKSESLLKETEREKVIKENQESHSTMSVSRPNSFSQLKVLSVKIPKMKIVVNSEEENLGSKSNSSVKLISKLKFVPSFSGFWDDEKESKVSDSKLKLELMKSQNFESRNNCELKNTDFKNTLDLKNDSENYKRIETIDNCFSAKKKIQRCTACGKKRKSSLNLNCHLEVGISEASELARIRNQDLTSTGIIRGNNSVSTVIKYGNSKIHKFTVESPHRVARNLAMETLKLAAKRIQNLYREVVLCRQCLKSRQSKNSNASANKSSSIQSDSHPNSEDISENRVELEKSISKTKTDFLPVDISKTKSKDLRKVFNKFEKSGCWAEKGTFCCKKRNCKNDNLTFQLVNVFSKSYTITFVGTVFFLIFLYLFT